MKKYLYGFFIKNLLSNKTWRRKILILGAVVSLMFFCFLGIAGYLAYSLASSAWNYAQSGQAQTVVSNTVDHSKALLEQQNIVSAGCFEQIKQLASVNILTEVPAQETLLKLCNACIPGKQTKTAEAIELLNL